MDYQNGRVYQILNNIDNDVYVGSTCSTLTKRLSWHKHRYDRQDKQHVPLYAKMHELGFDQFYIELVEQYPCNTREELRAREGHYIRERGTLNKVVAGRTQNQWRIDNKEKVDEHRRQYIASRREHFRAYHAQWRADNKDTQNKLNIQRYHENKELYNKARLTKETCPTCGTMVAKCNMSRHQQSNKCQVKCYFAVKELIS